MRRVTLRGLRRKLRTALTAFAVVLGVAMVTGSSILGATMKQAFDVVFSSAYQQTDVVVSGKQVVDWSESSAPTLPASMLREIRAVPGVETAAGAIFDFSGSSPYAIVLGPGGEKISGDPSFVMGFRAADERFNPLQLQEGRWAAGGRGGRARREHRRRPPREGGGHVAHRRADPRCAVPGRRARTLRRVLAAGDRPVPVTIPERRRAQCNGAAGVALSLHLSSVARAT